MSETPAAIVSHGEGRFELAGELSFATVPELLRAGNVALELEATVHLDLAGITRIDSAGIALLIELTRGVRRHGGEIVFEHAPPQLMAIAEVSGLGDVLPFARDEIPGN